MDVEQQRKKEPKKFVPHYTQVENDLNKRMKEEDAKLLGCELNFNYNLFPPDSDHLDRKFFYRMTCLASQYRPEFAQNDMYRMTDEELAYVLPRFNWNYFVRYKLDNLNVEFKPLKAPSFPVKK